MNGKYIPPHRRRLNETGGRNKQSSSSSKDLYEAHRVLQHAIPQAYCINLAHRLDKWNAFQKNVKSVSIPFLESVERLEAVDGTRLQHDCVEDDIQVTWDAAFNVLHSPKATPGIRTMSAGEIGCALSHVALWRKLVISDDAHYLILEDDCSFVHSRGRDRFAIAFCRAWNELPSDWAIFYLGFSSRGERRYVYKAQHSTAKRDELDPEIDIFVPEYGYHTHAYMITKAGAQCLLDNLPVQGPIDVWLADNKWFGLPTYCAVIANEGWRRDDGTFEGNQLVWQVRGDNFTSDVQTP